MVIIPNEDTAVIPCHKVEDEDKYDCITLGSDDSNVKEINKDKVKSVLEELAELRCKEADCIDKLAQAVPEMGDNEIVIVSEKIKGMDLPKHVYNMYDRIGNPRNFKAAFATGEQLLSLYHKNQVGADVETIQNLCTHFDVGQMKLFEILHCQKYGKEEPNVQKPPRCVIPVQVKEDPRKEKEEEEQPAPKKPRKEKGKKTTSEEEKSSPKKTKTTSTT